MNIIDFQNIVKNAFSFVTGTSYLNDLGFFGNSVTIKNTEHKETTHIAFNGSESSAVLQYNVNDDEFSLIGKSGDIKSLKSSFKYSYAHENIERDTNFIISLGDVTIDLNDIDTYPGKLLIIKHIGNLSTNIIGNIDDKDSIELSMSGISVTLMYTDQWYLV
jgi:hypothetical protein